MTKIRLTGQNEVTLTAIDPVYGDPIVWVFWVPTSGGYVRKGANHTADDQQVCEGLDTRGNTLRATDGDHLLAVIRRNWSIYRKWTVAA